MFRYICTFIMNIEIQHDRHQQDTLALLCDGGEITEKQPVLDQERKERAER